MFKELNFKQTMKTLLLQMIFNSKYSTVPLSVVDLGVVEWLNGQEHLGSDSFTTILSDNRVLGGGGGPGKYYVTIDFIWLKVNDISKDEIFTNTQQTIRSMNKQSSFIMLSNFRGYHLT